MKKDKLIGKFENEHGEKFEVWIKDKDILFKGDETDWEFMSFNADFIFSVREKNKIIRVLINYLKSNL